MVFDFEQGAGMAFATAIYRGSTRLWCLLCLSIKSSRRNTQLASFSTWETLKTLSRKMMHRYNKTDVLPAAF